MTTSLARRGANSIKINSVANLVSILISFSRSVLLARLLPIEVFGIYGAAMAVVALTGSLAKFGMEHAFIHRGEETRDIQVAAAVHFSLNILTSSIWLVGIVLGTLLLVPEQQLRNAILLCSISMFVGNMADTPRIFLIRKVIHNRIALIGVIDAILGSGIAILLAFQGVQLWALLIGNVITAILKIIFYYFWHPIWKPQFNWNKQGVRYYINFGRKQMLAGWLASAINNIDDLWIVNYLGNYAMGLYAKAFAFANYPRKLLADPINRVAFGTYAALKEDRQKLSEAVSKISSLLTRMSLIMGGLLFFIAPELILFLFGEKWIPMVVAFQLMLPYILLQPLKASISDLFSAMGCPQKLIKVRTIQLGVLAMGLFLLGPEFGIEGVAVAVDIMLLTGMGMLMNNARKFIDINISKTFLVPVGILVLSLGGSVYLFSILNIPFNLVGIMLIKSALFLGLYGVGLFLFDRRTISELGIFAWRYMLKR